MNIKKLISAAAAASIAAASLFAVSASAAEPKDIDLEYVNTSSGTAIGSVTYDESTNLSYSLTEKSSNELAKAKAGDTVTITYKVSADGEARYRAGLKIAGTQFYVNSSKINKINDKFLVSNACHLNADLNASNSAEITYAFELKDGGTIAKITEAKITVNGTENSYASKNLLPSTLANYNLTNLQLNTSDREKGDSSITLSDFKAVLTTTADTLAEVSPVTAVSDESGSYIFPGKDGWYAKAFKFDVTPGTNAVSKITVTAGGNSESKDDLSLTGKDATFVYGIIIGSQDEDALNEITADDIQVTTE